MEAIILAGGFGTRLKSVVSDVPKPMAPMDDKGRPFLSVLLNKIARDGVTHVVLSTGYMSETIESYFGKEYAGIRIDYSVENMPLFTGGAVKMALSKCEEDTVFVLNGDTYFDVDLATMGTFHAEQSADFTVAIKEMKDFDRYGTVEVQDGRIISFLEKQFCQHGWINGGIYCLNQSLLTNFPMTKFSLEKDFMEKKLTQMNMMAFPSAGYFIDIGVPEDYAIAKKKFGQEDDASASC